MSFIQSYPEYIIVLALLVLSFATYLGVYLIMTFIKLMVKKGEIQHTLFHTLKGPISLLSVGLFLRIAKTYLEFSNPTKTGFSLIFQLLLLAGFIWFIYAILDPLEKTLLKMASKTSSDLDDRIIPFLIKSVRILVIIFGVLLVVQNMGLNVFSLLAGLGLGGLAIALAAKDTASNFFGSLMILFDQPFKTGDWVKINEYEGTVEDIGFRSTRIRTFYDSLIIIPNATVANSEIDNLGLRKYRRTVETLGLTYSCSSEQIQKFIAGLNTIIKNHPQTNKDKFYISFNGFGESSLNILLYYFLKVESYVEELQARQDIFFSIKKLASDIDVDFAFPSQSLYIESLPNSQSPP